MRGAIFSLRVLHLRLNVLGILPCLLLEHVSLDQAPVILFSKNGNTFLDLPDENGVFQDERQRSKSAVSMECTAMLQEGHKNRFGMPVNGT